MTIDEAIKTLRKDIDDPGSVAIENVNEAEELGIEALKRCKARRSLIVCADITPLPGETEK